jgi:hypothetical protein
MKLTVDTRHDSLEDALAAVRAAFGPNAEATSTRQSRKSARPNPRGNVSGAKRSGSGAQPATKSAHKRSPTNKNVGNVQRPLATKKSGRNISTAAVNLTSNTAPPGQADAIRAWAKAQSMDVKRAGRLPAAVIRAYQQQAHHN